jgi:hypothetical protein
MPTYTARHPTRCAMPLAEIERLQSEAADLQQTKFDRGLSNLPNSTQVCESPSRITSTLDAFDFELKPLTKVTPMSEAGG